MNMFHDWLLGHTQKFVDLAAKLGFSLFFLVNLSFVLHVLTLLFLCLFVESHYLFFFGLGTLLIFIGWVRDEECIKAGMANQRKVNTAISHCFLADLALGLVPSPFSLYFLTAAVFLVISQCDYVEPQARQRQPEKVFVA